MKIIATILKDLGFKKLTGIMDGNQSHLIAELKAQFPEYNFVSISANDVRDKPAQREKLKVMGLTNSDGSLKEEHKQSVRELFMNINSYFNNGTAILEKRL